MRRLAAPALLLFLAAPLRSEDTPRPETTARSEAAARKAVAWLLKAVNPDGGCGADQRCPSEPGLTAAVGLALMAEGSTPTKGPRAAVVRRLLNHALLSVDRMQGRNLWPSGSEMQRAFGELSDGYFVALFLSQAAGESEDSRPLRALRRLVPEIAAAQRPDGGWGDDSWAPMLGNVMGWVSLRASAAAGVRAKASADRTAERIIQQMRQRQAGRTARSGGADLYSNAAGIRVLHSMRRGKDPIARKAFEDVLVYVGQGDRAFTGAGGEDFLAFLMLTDSALQQGGMSWDRWYPNARDKLIQVQNADGSWTGAHCFRGRTFCTATALTVLLAPNRYLPIAEY